LEVFNLSKKISIVAKGTGRRKSAVAQVTIFPGSGEFLINGKTARIYMNENPMSMVALEAPYDLLGFQQKFETHVKVYGGGLIAQAKAVELGIARALCKINPTQIVKLETDENISEIQKSYRTLLKHGGFLTRDARCKERKKYGLKKARKAPQYSKR